MSALLALLVITGCCDPSTGYTANGTLALDPLMLEGEVDEAAIEAWMATEVIVLQSWQIRERAVQRLELREPFGATEMDAVEGLGTALEVARMEGSTVFEVLVTTPDPEASAEACNAVMEAYLDHRIEQRIAPLLEQEEWLSEQVDRQHTELVEARREGVPEVASLQALYEQTAGRLTEVSLERTLMQNDARIIDRCLMPTSP